MKTNLKSHRAQFCAASRWWLLQVTIVVSLLFTQIVTAHATEFASEESVLITKEDGQTVVNSNPELALNGASTIKLLTALAVLKSFGPTYQFSTTVLIQGTVDTQTETLHGDIYIQGHDPTLSRERLAHLEELVRQSGIQRVVGNLYVEQQFCLDRQCSDSARRSLIATVHPAKPRTKRTSASAQPTARPVLIVNGNIKVLTSIPAAAKSSTLAAVSSVPLKQILKTMLTFSDNYLAERLGSLIGAAKGLMRVMREQFGLSSSLKLATTSGLGVNRITTGDLEKVLRSLIALLAKANLTPDSIMAVGGLEGTLRNRFTDNPGTVIAKTGTLHRTDRGVSALAGMMRTANGTTFFFVILHQHGATVAFKRQEESFLRSFQNLHGGPARFSFLPAANITITP